MGGSGIWCPSPVHPLWILSDDCELGLALGPLLRPHVVRLYGLVVLECSLSLISSALPKNDLWRTGFSCFLGRCCSSQLCKMLTVSLEHYNALSPSRASCLWSPWLQKNIFQAGQGIHHIFRESSILRILWESSIFLWARVVFRVCLVFFPPLLWFKHVGTTFA